MDSYFILVLVIICAGHFQMFGCNSLTEYAEYASKSLPCDQENIHCWKIFTSDTETCARNCSNMQKENYRPCSSFTYSHGRCLLSNITTASLGRIELQSLEGSSYYERSRGTYERIFRKIRNKYLSIAQSYRRILYNVTRDECANQCLLTSAFLCGSFAYSSTGEKICALADRFARTIDQLIDIRLYDYYYYIPLTWHCNATLPWNYKPFVMATPDFPYQTFVGSTCFTRIVAPYGYRIQLTFTTLFLQSDTCTEQDGGIYLYDGISQNATLLYRICHATTTPLTFFSSGGCINVVTESTIYSVAYKAVYQFLHIDLCQNHQCINGATCIPADTVISSQCTNPFTRTLHTRQAEAVNDDSVSLERNNSLAYTCICLSGYQGKFCQHETNPCDHKPCRYGNCTVTDKDKFTCTCIAGFTGSRCETDVNECLNDPCPGSRCTNLLGGYSCECADCVYGFCAVKGGDSFCLCFNGYSGVNCSENINECQSSPCVHGSCIDYSNGYKCKCERGYTGFRCEKLISDPCNNNPCYPLACKPDIDRVNYACACNDSACERTNETTCRELYCVQGYCLEVGNRPKCICDQGFTGVKCDVKIVNEGSTSSQSFNSFTMIPTTVSSGTVNQTFPTQRETSSSPITVSPQIHMLQSTLPQRPEFMTHTENFVTQVSLKTTYLGRITTSSPKEITKHMPNKETLLPTFSTQMSSSTLRLSGTIETQSTKMSTSKEALLPPFSTQMSSSTSRLPGTITTPPIEMSASKESLLLPFSTKMPSSTFRQLGTIATSSIESSTTSLAHLVTHISNSAITKTIVSSTTPIKVQSSSFPNDASNTSFSPSTINCSEKASDQCVYIPSFGNCHRNKRSGKFYKSPTCFCFILNSVKKYLHEVPTPVFITQLYKGGKCRSKNINYTNNLLKYSVENIALCILKSNLTLFSIFRDILKKSRKGSAVTLSTICSDVELCMFINCLKDVNFIQNFLHEINMPASLNSKDKVQQTLSVTHTTEMSSFEHENITSSKDINSNSGRFCQNNKCIHGICRPTEYGYICECFINFTGSYCESEGTISNTSPGVPIQDNTSVKTFIVVSVLTAVLACSGLFLAFYSIKRSKGRRNRGSKVSDWEFRPKVIHPEVLLSQDRSKVVHKVDGCETGRSEA